jgi:hypothetical protein
MKELREIADYTLAITPGNFNFSLRHTAKREWPKNISRSLHTSPSESKTSREPSEAREGRKTNSKHDGGVLKPNKI